MVKSDVVDVGVLHTFNHIHIWIWNSIFHGFNIKIHFSIYLFLCQFNWFKCIESKPFIYLNWFLFQLFRVFYTLLLLLLMLLVVAVSYFSCMEFISEKKQRTINSRLFLIVYFWIFEIDEFVKVQDVVMRVHLSTQFNSF